jgi:hypothetical protein
MDALCPKYLDLTLELNQGVPGIEGFINRIEYFIAQSPLIRLGNTMSSVISGDEINFWNVALAKPGHPSQALARFQVLTRPRPGKENQILMKVGGPGAALLIGGEREIPYEGFKYLISPLYQGIFTLATAIDVRDFTGSESNVFRRITSEYTVLV